MIFGDRSPELRRPGKRKRLKLGLEQAKGASKMPSLILGSQIGEGGNKLYKLIDRNILDFGNSDSELTYK